MLEEEGLRCPTADAHSCYLRLSVAQAQTHARTVARPGWLPQGEPTRVCLRTSRLTLQVHLDRTRTGGTNLPGWLSCEYTSALRTLCSFSGSHSPCTPIPLCRSLPLVFNAGAGAPAARGTHHISFADSTWTLPMKAGGYLTSNGRLSRGRLNAGFGRTT